MKKRLLLLALATLVAGQAFARYVVILKDNTRYNAKAKWTVVNGKAIVNLENGQSLSLDPALIDVAKSERATKLGYDATVIDLNPGAAQQTQTATRQPSLGDSIRLRPRNNQNNTPAPAAPKPATPAPVTTSGAGAMPERVLENFDRAYEELRIFEKKIEATGPRSIKATLTVDTEDRVFQTLSATSFLMMKNAGVQGAQIDVVELFMKTTIGGSAGRFQMTRADAEAIDKAQGATRQAVLQDYFLRKVIY